MRTAIYVLEPTTVTIRALDATERLELLPYNQARAPRVAAGTHSLPAGIYMIVSRVGVAVEGSGVVAESTPTEKDPWPVPKAHLLALEPNASNASIQAFFDVEKAVGD